MGQDCSWPCAAKRKEQEKRLMQSKYVVDFAPDEPSEDEIERKTERLHNLEKIQEIIERKSYTTGRNKDSTATERKFKSSQPHSPTHSDRTGSAFTFTDDSVGGDNELPIVFIADDIDKIDSFVNKVCEKYNPMMPSIIIPHPSKRKAIVVFQSMNLISNISSGKQHKYHDFEKDPRTENNNNAYQILVKFLKEQYDNGLEYLGYYLDVEGKYHFIFSEKMGKPTEKSNLDFVTLSGVSQVEIQHTLNKAVKEHYKLKGMITLLGNKTSSNPLSFIILERKKINIEQYIMVNVAGNTFEENGVNLDFSRKIELGCQSDELDVAGLVVNHEDNSLYLVFSKQIQI